MVRGSAASAVVLVALAVLACLATATGTSPGTSPGTPQPKAGGQPVRERLAVCPARPGDTAGRSGPAWVGSLPADALGSGGAVRSADLGAGARSVPLRRGALRRLGATPARDLVVQAQGPIAAGLYGVRTDTGGAHGGAPGLAVHGCPAPRASWWFVGAGSTLDHVSDLVLTNADPGPAVVDVRVLGPHGPVDTLGTRGITVAPHSRQTLHLADVAPQRSRIALDVEATRGRVVAAVADSFAPEPGARPGTAWLPDADSPSRVVHLGGTTGRATGRTLLVANPSELEALVTLRVAGASGTYAPAGAGPLRVPPGSVVATDVGDVLKRDPAALVLHSRVPVVATVRTTTRDDLVYAGTVPPLHGRAVAPLLPDTRASVLLTAGGLPATAEVSTYTRGGRRVGSAQLRVPAGATTSWRPPRRSGYVVVDRQGGALFATARYRGGGEAGLALTTLPVRLRRPVVQPLPAG